jgi:hypothetical protein
MTRFNTPFGSPEREMISVKRPGGTGNEIGRLEDDRVAEGQCGRHLPRRNGDGEVPRADEAHDADGLARDQHIDAGADGSQRHAFGAERFLREELEDLGGARRLGDAVRQRLSFLTRQKPSDLVLAGEKLDADEFENVGALSCGVVALHAGRAALAAAMADSVCALSAWAYSPTMSVMSDGLMFSRTALPSSHSPLMKFRCSAMMIFPDPD